MPLDDTVPNIRMPSSIASLEELSAELFPELRGRALQILARRWRGWSARMIAEDLHLSHGAVSVYDAMLLHRLDVQSVRELPFCCCRRLFERRQRSR